MAKFIRWKDTIVNVEHIVSILHIDETKSIYLMLVNGDKALFPASKPESWKEFQKLIESQISGVIEWKDE